MLHSVRSATQRPITGQYQIQIASTYVSEFARNASLDSLVAYAQTANNGGTGKDHGIAMKMASPMAIYLIQSNLLMIPS